MLTGIISRCLLVAAILCGSAQARFYSTDPIGYQDQLNLYAYVHNDPVNNIDPNGEETLFSIRENQRNLRLLNGEITPEEFHAEQMAEGHGALMGLGAVALGADVAAAYTAGRSIATFANATRSFSAASRLIRATTEGFAKTGGRSGGTTFQSFGEGGRRGAEKRFNALTNGKSEALERGGRLGSLGDGVRVQVGPTRNGVTSVRITQKVERTGYRIKTTETIKVRFKEDELK